MVKRTDIDNPVEMVRRAVPTSGPVALHDAKGVGDEGVCFNLLCHVNDALIGCYKSTLILKQAVLKEAGLMPLEPDTLECGHTFKPSRAVFSNLLRGRESDTLLVQCCHATGKVSCTSGCNRRCSI